MSLIDKITGKKESTSAKSSADKESKKTSRKKKEDVLNMVKEDGKTSEVKVKENTGLAHRILNRYHLSEKSNIVSQNGRYVFKVSSSANKIEVKKAVEAVYDVHVAAVNIVNLPGKSRRYGRQLGRTSDWKKAYVTLKEGEKITGLAEGI
jgi:large subunit ribosomal protein L23